MRFFSALGVLSFAFFLSAVGAAQAEKPVYSQTVCQGTVMRCADANYVPLYEWEDKANACLGAARRGVESGFFEHPARMDGENCLIPKPNVYAQTMGMRVDPRCCVIPLENDQCGMLCALVEQ